MKATRTQRDELAQRFLKDAGHRPGPIDGDWGPKSNAAWGRYQKATGNGKSFAEIFRKIAVEQVGTKEVGSNGGPAIRKYQAATWLEPGSWPWCAAFVCWCFREAAKITDPGIKRPQTAGAWDFERWAKKAGAKLIKPGASPKPGDIVVFEFSHIGIVDRNRVELRTIEGNTNEEGGREGDGVYRRVRKMSQVRSLIRIES